MEANLSFSTADLATTRFAISPMWEVVTSFRLLAGAGAGAAPPLHRRWAAQVRPRLVEAGLDSGWLAELIPSGGYLADFLNPTPDTPFPALETELAAIRQTPRDRVHADLDHLAQESGNGRRTPRARLLYEAPEAALEKVTAEIEAYWELALAPYWARIRQLLEADVFHRARMAAEHGTAHVLNELHETVSWDDGSLRLVRRQCAMTRADTGSGLLLVPSAFAWPRVLTRSVPPDPPQLAYPARGIGVLWEPRETPAADAVAAVLGRSRTLLLAELDTPASTTQLARTSGLSAAGVSQHLTALRNAGLVTAHRAGRSVLYARTSVADALLTPAVG
jgi:DNA-binding transcriptional ArsR family regulator